MKKYLALAGLFAALLALFIWQNHEIGVWKEKCRRAQNNVEAYQARNSNYENDIREYQMTMNELRASRDSIDKKLVEMADELKLKDKRIQYLQYQTRTIEKVDTVVFRDTIFKTNLKLDTLLFDEWYSLTLKLRYPSSIVAYPSFRSEQYVFVNKKREFNRKPSRIFFVRWFQKKHDVIEVVVKEKNEYITNNEQRFIKVIE